MARLYVQMQEARVTPVPEPEMISEVVRVADLQTRCTGRILATPDGELHQMPFSWMHIRSGHQRGGAISRGITTIAWKCSRYSCRRVGVRSQESR
jgi:hypothetical protein